MTKAELDKQIAEKKMAELTDHDKNMIRLFKHGNDHLLECVLTDVTAEKLVKLNLARKVKSFKDSLDNSTYNAPEGQSYLQLNNFGKMIRQRLENGMVYYA